MDVFRLPVATTTYDNSNNNSNNNDNNDDNDNDNTTITIPVTTTATNTSTLVEYPPRIPVVMRHPHFVTSVKQYRSEAQQQQLQQHIISESFIPMAPDMMKPPRRRRRPPFSYSSLIAQAILEAEQERMTLQEIYKWIKEKYPALYDVEDTGWQNTIRHNLSLNKCFKKIPKAELVNGSNCRGKGGYWTIDPNYIEKFKNGVFAKGSSSNILSKRKTPRQIRMKPTIDIDDGSPGAGNIPNLPTPLLTSSSSSSITTPTITRPSLLSIKPSSYLSSQRQQQQQKSHLPPSSKESSTSSSPSSTTLYISHPTSPLSPQPDASSQQSQVIKLLPISSTSPSSSSFYHTSSQSLLQSSSPTSSPSPSKPNIMHVHSLLN
ncbi:fork head domain-containing protein [Circinella umbellata]|nr:fork head domain-containing protein [Circinella umbellata]